MCLYASCNLHSPPPLISSDHCLPVCLRDNLCAWLPVPLTAVAFISPRVTPVCSLYCADTGTLSGPYGACSFLYWSKFFCSFMHIWVHFAYNLPRPPLSLPPFFILSPSFFSTCLPSFCLLILSSIEWFSVSISAGFSFIWSLSLLHFSWIARPWPSPVELFTYILCTSFGFLGTIILNFFPKTS